MRQAQGVFLWVLAACAAVLVVLGVGATLQYLAADVAQRPQLIEVAGSGAPAVLFGMAIMMLVAGIWASWLYRRHPHAARQLAEQSRSLLAAEKGFRVTTAGAPALAELASVINQLADAYHGVEHDLEIRSAETRARVEEERDRFAALMSELSQGVLVCNADGRILLYNPRAAALLGPAADGSAAGRYTPLGLGRSVLALLDRNQVAHALDMIQHQLDHVDRPQARFVATVANGALLRVQVAPFLSAERRVAGMVFTLDDVSGLVGRESQRLRLLQSLATGVRSPAANLRAAAENLAAFPDMPAERRAQFVDIAVAEARVLTDRLNTALREYADALKGSLTLEDMRAVDLLAVVQRRIAEALQLPVAIEEAETDLWLRVDSFAIAQAMTFLAARLANDYEVRGLRLRAGSGGGFAEVDLMWTGAIVASDALPLWEGEPMRIGAEETPLTLRDVLERHGSEAWLQVDKIRQISRFRLLLPRGQATAAAYRGAAAESRPEFYDFDLFDRIDAAGALAERRLAELSYTVFDTETTGLEPSAGDEIISIGAVRIVNGRLLKQEVFEQLVNPRRQISRESTAVHGIDGKQVANEPPIEQVLPRFHRFCEDTVLVAHNAAFDMRFLELKEASTGVRFGQPVLDTLLLSAVVHPSLDNHHLDTIAERLGVRVIGRHTALGDALLTGEVFLRLLPLLAERGIVTLAQALEASRATYHARLQY
jgi:DNA polymerase-3 subunit epsilon